MAMERSYVLGTHDEELARLGLQHDVWRPVVLDCWSMSGIKTGASVLDVGAGPGYATVDLAKIVGPSGKVVAIERSNKFVQAMKENCRQRALTNVEIHELDLMTDELPKGDYDFSWCRWLLCFVSEPAMVIQKLAGVMRAGAVAIFHEYAHYETWRFVPPLPTHLRFREHVIETWRQSGGEPDSAIALPQLLSQNGFVIRSATPRIFCIRPTDFMWQWPAQFIEVYLPRLQEIGRIDEKFAAQMRADMAGAERDPNSLMITPLVLEIVADKL